MPLRKAKTYKFNKDESAENEDIISTTLKYHNYLYLPDDFENNYGFFYLCKYEYAFKGCSSLTQITIPSSVTSIGSSAFLGCSSLTQITISSSITKIGDSAFSGCVSLVHIVLPFTMLSINENVFNGCPNILLYYQNDIKLIYQKFLGHMYLNVLNIIENNMIPKEICKQVLYEENIQL